MSEWINVEERIPETRNEVVVANFSSELYEVATFEMGTWWGNDQEELSFYPTHWTSLPKPPE